MAIYRVLIQGFAGSAFCETATHFLDASDAMAADAVASEINANWLETWRNLQSMNYSLRAVNVLRVFPSLGQAFTLGINKVGASGGGLLPSQICWLIHFYTGLGGRSNRGRMYLPGISASHVSGNTITSTGSQQMNIAIPAIQSRYCGGAGQGPLRLVVRSRVTGNNIQVNSLSNNTIPSTFRTRKVGVGL